jgi:MFS family permease
MFGSMFVVPRDSALICLAGGLRAAAVSLVGVIVAIHLSNRGLSASGIGLIIGVGIASSAAGTVITALRADRWGRRRTLIVLGVLTGAGYAALAFTAALPVLVAVAAVAMLNCIGRDRGPGFRTRAGAAAIDDDQRTPDVDDGLVQRGDGLRPCGRGPGCCPPDAVRARVST